MLTATAMGYFEKEIARAVVLALFVPLIISSGGNSGSQATTLIIRALALREVTLARLVARRCGARCSPGSCWGSSSARSGFCGSPLWQTLSLSSYGEHWVLRGDDGRARRWSVSCCGDRFRGRCCHSS